MKQESVLSLSLSGSMKRPAPYTKLDKKLRKCSESTSHGLRCETLKSLRYPQVSPLPENGGDLTDCHVSGSPPRFSQKMVTESNSPEGETLLTPPPKTTGYTTKLSVPRATFCFIVSQNTHDKNGEDFFSQNEYVTPRIMSKTSSEMSSLSLPTPQGVLGYLMATYPCPLPGSPESPPKCLPLVKRTQNITPQGTPQRETYLKTPPAPRRQPHQKLLHAILKGDRQMVIKALEEGEDPNLPLVVPAWVLGEETTLLPLLVASKLAYTDVVLVLLQYGAVLGSVNSQGRNALHLLFSNQSVQETDLSCGEPLELHHASAESQDWTSSEPKNVSLVLTNLEHYFHTLCTESAFNTEDETTDDTLIESPSCINLNIQLPDLSLCTKKNVSRRFPTKQEILSCAQMLLHQGIDAYQEDIFGLTPHDMGLREGYFYSDNFTEKKSFDLSQKISAS